MTELEALQAAYETMKAERDDALRTVAEGNYAASLGSGGSIYQHALALTVETLNKCRLELDKSRAETKRAWDGRDAQLREVEQAFMRNDELCAEIKTLKIKLERCGDALRWYASEACGAEGAVKRMQTMPHVGIAILTVLALDAGKRADDAMA